MTTRWIATFTGKRIDPFNADPEMICIEDVAHALSQICRYGGHSRCFYSVAQHSVLVAEEANRRAIFRYGMTPREAAVVSFQGLLHDAAEAYLNDIPRPIKHRIEMGFYREAESRLATVIYEAFGLPEFNHAAVLEADEELLAIEAPQLMGDTSGWGIPRPRTFITIRPQECIEAEATFLSHFRMLSEKL